MTIYQGFEGVIKQGNDTLAEIRNWSLEQSTETADASVIGDEWQHYVPTLKNWSGSLSAWWDESDSGGQSRLTLGKKITLQLYPGGEHSDRSYFSGEAYVTSIQLSGSHDGIVEAEFNFQGTGALRQLTVMKSGKAAKPTPENN